MSPAEKMAEQKGDADAPRQRFRIVWRCSIRKRRDDLHLSLRDVEKGTGINNVVINYIERGADVTLSNACKLAGFFGCAISDLWEPI